MAMQLEMMDEECHHKVAEQAERNSKDRIKKTKGAKKTGKVAAKQPKKSASNKAKKAGAVVAAIGKAKKSKIKAPK